MNSISSENSVAPSGRFPCVGIVEVVVVVLALWLREVDHLRTRFHRSRVVVFDEWAGVELDVLSLIEPTLDAFGDVAVERLEPATSMNSSNDL
jgi:hypothetical protein